MLDHEGYLAFFERQASGKLKPGHRIFLNEDGQPLRLNEREAGKSGRRKWCFGDWDADGRLDLLVNSRSVDLLRNVGKGDEWVFREEGPVTQQQLAGHTTSPTMVDWDGDGKQDLLVGAEDGYFYLIKHSDNQINTTQIGTGKLSESRQTAGRPR